MTPHPVGLSAQQLDLVIDAANRLPCNWRSRFLDAVADRLLTEAEVIRDTDVETAIASVLVRMKGIAA